MNMLITNILQYPVKGLSEESLISTELVTGVGMPADRVFALSHGKSLFDHNKPAWVARNHFTVVAHSPEIGPIHCQFDHTNKSLTLTHQGKIILQSKADAATIDTQLTDALTRVIKNGQPGPYRLVSVQNKRLTDSPTNTVSIMNTQSLQALEEALGQPLDKRRFRGNIWFDGDHAWQEHEWVGKPIQIGDAKLFVTERIERCAAIDADPALGTRNLAVLKQLNKSFRHVNFGVLAEVEATAFIQIGDTIMRPAPR